MEEVKSNQPSTKPPLPDILTLASKEKFRRGLVITSRIIALLLIGAIIWIGYIQLNYAQNVQTIQGKYGSMGYCYLCGLETLRSCNCQYRTEVELTLGKLDIKELANMTAENNIAPCLVKGGFIPVSFNFTNFHIINGS